MAASSVVGQCLIAVQNERNDVTVPIHRPKGGRDLQIHCDVQ